MNTFDVTDDASLRAAIFEISNDLADDGIVNGSTGATPPYTISINNDITLVKSLPMIRGDLSHLITINGHGHTIDANNTGRVFFVESGKVAINSVSIAHALAQGGTGGATSFCRRRWRRAGGRRGAVRQQRGDGHPHRSACFRRDCQGRRRGYRGRWLP
jgi:hypothetical protein